MQKKIIVLSLLLLFMCGAIATSQILSSSEIDKIQDELLKSQPVRFSMYGGGIYAPFVYRGYGDTKPESLIQMAPANNVETSWGPAYGVGTGGGDNFGANMGFTMSYREKTEHFGINLTIRSMTQKNGNLAINNPGGSNVWAKPFGEILEMYMGLYSWGAMNGRNFRPVDSSDTLGLMLIFRPPSSVPEAFKGITVFGSFGSSGGLSTGFRDYKNFGARAGNLWGKIFSNPQVGIGYNNSSFGRIRFQYIGGRYLWGGGDEFDSRLVSYPWYGEDIYVPNVYLPRRTSWEKRLETAINITVIPRIGLDFGASIPLPVTIVDTPNNNIRLSTMLGPLMWDPNSVMGWRLGSPMAAIYSVASLPGDVWYERASIGAGISYNPSKLPDFSIGLSGNIEFGSHVEFENGGDDYIFGDIFSFSIGPQYRFARFGTVRCNASIRIKQNDSYEGDNLLLEIEPGKLNQMQLSFNHNGTIDLGLGFEWDKQILPGLRFRIGFNMNLPIGGDRYKWGRDSASDLNMDVNDPNVVYFSKETTERFRQANLWISVPITLNVNL